MGFALVAIPAALPAESSEFPTAEWVVDQILDRAVRVAQDTEGCSYIYEQRARVEELDAKNQVLHATEKTYRVFLIQGFPFSRLIGIEGQSLSASELRKEDLREREFRRRITDRDFESMAERKETWVNRELMARYHFTVERREVYEDRTMLVLDFAPRAGLPPAQRIQDQILNRLAGRLWVDEADFEVGKMEVRLIEGFSLGWLGILGSIQECDIEFKRLRMPDGCWVNRGYSVFLTGRKLFMPMRLRMTEKCSGFRENRAAHPGLRPPAEPPPTPRNPGM